MVPSINSYTRHTDHGPCADPHVYKQAQIYETVPRLSTCDILLHCSALLPHCSTPYSSAFAQHCIVAYLATPPRCTCLHPYRLHPPRVLPSDPVSLLQVRPLPTISSESQHLGKVIPSMSVSLIINADTVVLAVNVVGVLVWGVGGVFDRLQSKSGGIALPINCCLVAVVVYLGMLMDSNE